MTSYFSIRYRYELNSLPASFFFNQCYFKTCLSWVTTYGTELLNIFIGAKELNRKCSSLSFPIAECINPATVSFDQTLYM